MKSKWSYKIWIVLRVIEILFSNTKHACTTVRILLANSEKILLNRFQKFSKFINVFFFNGNTSSKLTIVTIKINS